MLITLPLPLWRCIRVSGDCTLRKLHHFIQAVMGWNSSHLHQFSLGEQRFMPPDLGFPEPGVLDDRMHKLRRLLKQGDRLRYLYDLGDCWQHVIAAEAVEPAEVAGTWCEVLAGARACPPEDIGSVPGYQGFLESISQRPLDEDGRVALEWAGGNFDAELFDHHSANASVQRICNNLWGEPYCSPP